MTNSGPTTTDTIADGGQPLTDPTTMPYETAKAELRAIVTELEVGSVPLEQTLELWRRGEALAARCREILDAASAEIERATAGPDVDPTIRNQ